jgi:hypothetical protein
MNIFRAIAAITINPGAVLLLSPEQASGRVYALDDIGEGLFLVKAPTQFKAGESFGYDGEVNKQIAEVIVEIEVDDEVPGEVDDN